MTIDLSGGAPIGSVIFEGKHAPFRALACPLLAMTTGLDESPLDSPQSRRARRALKFPQAAALSEWIKYIKKAGRALPASFNSPAEQTGERNSQAYKM